MHSYKTIIFDLDGTIFKAQPISVSGQLYEGVKDMLGNLKRGGYTLGIYTNESLEYINKVLSHFNIAEYFQIKKHRIEGLEKYQLIKQILDESASCNAVIVGAAAIDFEGADAVRCLSIGVSYGYGGEDYKNADFTAESPKDIYDIVNKINGVFKATARHILHKKQSNKPLMVGINGVDTSGKSMFTKEFSKYLSKLGFKIQCISIDDFHNPSDIRYREKDPVASYLNNAFNIEMIENEIMKPIKTDNKLDKEFLLLNLEEDKFTNHKKYFIDEDTIVLFEGILLYREPLNQYFDLRIFIDISFDEVLKRAVKRDASLFGAAVADRYKNKYIPIQKLYMEKYKPKALSDIVIDNNDYNNPQIIKGSNSKVKKECRIQLK